jgi:glutamyl-tRNA reductase
MDIAVPRDVDAEVKNISGVYLHDLDTLSNHLESNIAQREAEVPRVQAILAEERAAFEEYLASLNVVPIIVDMRNQADSIRQVELQKAIRRMPDLTPEMERQIDALTKSIINKILHSPTARLRAEANGHNAADYASVARALFGLD